MKRVLLLLPLLLARPLSAEETPPVTTEPVAATSRAAAAVDPEMAVIEQLRAVLPAGAWQELSADGKPFSALYLPSHTAAVRGAAILLHDIDANADDDRVIGRLRRQLPEQGWHTLSIQLPLFTGSTAGGLPPSALEQARARLAAAADWWRQQRPERLVVIGHGFGGNIAIDYAATARNRLDGVVVIAMGTAPGDPPVVDTPATLGKVAAPLHDLYGSRDRADVLAAAERRRPLLLRRAHAGLEERDNWPPNPPPRTRQVEIHHANHDLSAMGDQLHLRVAGWLRRLAETNRR